MNPMMPLLTQAFQNYRKKQADKPDQKWPDVLEGPFLDGKHSSKHWTPSRAVCG